MQRFGGFIRRIFPGQRPMAPLHDPYITGSGLRVGQQVQRALEGLGQPGNAAHLENTIAILLYTSGHVGDERLIRLAASHFATQFSGQMVQILRESQIASSVTEHLRTMPARSTKRKTIY